MPNLTTVDDLRADALFRAGEQQSASSKFWVQSVIYLNAVQRDLLLGGQIAVGRDLATSAGIYDQLVSSPIVDWWWARSRGVLTTTPARLTDTVTLTEGSVSGTLGATVATSLAGYRLQANNLPTIPLISAHTGGSAAITLDAAWPEDSQAAVTTRLWQENYTLANDFLRFASRPYLHSTWSSGIDVGTVENRIADFPIGLPLQGPPTRAFLIGPRTIVFNAFDDRAYRFEYEYIALPTDLAAGGTPILPVHHRRVLSAGAAMQIAHDKGDDRAKTFASEFRELVGRMGQEHRKAMGAGSSTFGMFKTRQTWRVPRSQQPHGELFWA